TRRKRHSETSIIAAVDVCHRLSVRGSPYCQSGFIRRGTRFSLSDRPRPGRTYDALTFDSGLSGRHWLTSLGPHQRRSLELKFFRWFVPPVVGIVDDSYSVAVRTVTANIDDGIRGLGELISVPVEHS